jgi:hypothetical protein
MLMAATQQHMPRLQVLSVESVVCYLYVVAAAACLQDTNQKLQAKVRDAAAGSNATEAQLDSLQEKLAKQQ